MEHAHWAALNHSYRLITHSLDRNQWLSEPIIFVYFSRNSQYRFILCFDGAYLPNFMDFLHWLIFRWITCTTRNNPPLPRHSNSPWTLRTRAPRGTVLSLLCYCRGYSSGYSRYGGPRGKATFFAVGHSIKTIRSQFLLPGCTTMANPPASALLFSLPLLPKVCLLVIFITKLIHW